MVGLPPLLCSSVVISLQSMTNTPLCLIAVVTAYVQTQLCSQFSQCVCWFSGTKFACSSKILTGFSFQSLLNLFFQVHTNNTSKVHISQEFCTKFLPCFGLAAPHPPNSPLQYISSENPTTCSEKADWFVFASLFRSAEGNKQEDSIIWRPLHTTTPLLYA